MWVNAQNSGSDRIDGERAVTVKDVNPVPVEVGLTDESGTEGDAHFSADRIGRAVVGMDVEMK